MTRIKTHAALGAIAAIFANPAISDGSDAGQVSWNSGVASFSEVLCGLSGDGYAIVGQSEGVRLRLGFIGDGTLESVDFADLTNVDLSFRDAHILSGHRFARYRSMGEMGEIEATPETASGTLTLRPGSAEALDARPDGLEISYSLECTGAYF